MTKILVFIPTYNCASQIVRVLQRFDSPTISRWFDGVLVLDNRSSDNTLQAARDSAMAIRDVPVVVAKNVENVGLGGSHKVAIDYALKHDYSHIVVLHGDDQADIEDLLPILSAGRHLSNDCCLGARFHRDSTLRGYSTFRIFGNKVFNILFSIAARRRVLDLGSGLNIYKVAAVSDPIVQTFANDLTFNCYLLLFSISSRQSLEFFPISWREEDQISNVKLVRQAARTVGIAVRFAIKGRQGLEGFGQVPTKTIEVVGDY